MCGRFDRHRPVVEFGDVIDELDFSDGDPVAPSYNVAPSQKAAVACRTDSGIRLLDLTWGLVPSWLTREGFSKPINARAETVADKPMFRDAFRRARCLVLCDGYYEWRSEKAGVKQPYYITTINGDPFVMAGIWAQNTNFDKAMIESFCVITTEANDSCREVHHRMPLILEKNQHDKWLSNAKLDSDTAAVLLKPPRQEMKLRPVSRYVNAPANNGPQCIASLQNQETV